MSRFIGLDAHTQSCTAVVLGKSDRRLREQVLETNASVLTDFVLSIARPRYLCMEEGTHSAWLYEVLEPIVDELVVVQPTQSRGPKNDSRDAWKLANDLRRGNVDTRVFKNPQPFRELREAVQAHRIVQRDLLRVKNRLHAVCRSRGLHAVARELYDGVSRRDVLPQLPEHVRHRASIWCDELDMLVDCHERAERWLREAAARTDIVGTLSTAPGLGTIRASQIVATVVTPHRFRTKRQFWSYCGLGVVTRSSADWVRHGDVWKRQNNVAHTRGLNRNRHPVMKSVFKGAAMTVITKVKSEEHPLKQHYRRLLEGGTRPNLARLTIARRIAAAVLAMWKNNEEYNPANK